MKKTDANLFSKLKYSNLLIVLLSKSLFVINSFFKSRNSIFNLKQVGFLLLTIYSINTTIAQSGTPLIIPNDFNGSINCQVTDDNGNLYVAGYFTNQNRKYYVAKWDGVSWSVLGGENNSTFNSPIESIISDDKGKLYVCGQFSNQNGKAYIAKWDGSKWIEYIVGSPNNFIQQIKGIKFNKVGEIYCISEKDNGRGVFKWNGTSWIELLGTNNFNFNNLINSIEIDDLGNVYAGGLFTNQNGSYFIAKWDGSNWNELGGTNNSKFGKTIYSILTDKMGNIYTTGFESQNLSYYAAKFNGNSWSSIGNGFNTFRQVYSMKMNSSGNIVVGGEFENSQSVNNDIAKWDGNNWNDLYFNAPIFNGRVKHLTYDKNSNLFVSGYNSSNIPSVVKFFNVASISSFEPKIVGKGTQIIIKGTNFYGVTGVKFGSDAASTFTILNDSTIIATVGNGSSGDVTILNPGGLASLSGFTFVPRPIVNSFNPSTSSSNANVTIVGSNFNTTQSVKFGGLAAKSFNVIDNNTITAIVLNGSSGYVSVTTLGGIDSLGGFVFIPAPKITSFTPTTADVGETVTIIGSNFNDASSVTFGGYPAKSFSILSSGTIQAVLDSGNTGYVSLVTPGGVDSLTGFIHKFVKTGMDELVFKNIQIYPNPAQDVITIQSDYNLKGQAYSIYDCVGKLMNKGVLNENNNSISTQELTYGIYTLEIGTKNKHVIKLVKQSNN